MISTLKKRAMLGFLVFFVVAGVDVAIRSYCLQTLCFSSFSFFGIELYRNFGSVFSFSNLELISLWLPLTVAICILSWISYQVFVRKVRPNVVWLYILGFGTVNILDRFINGFVVDYIRIHTGFFNLADLGILVCLLILFFKK